jgi:3-oxoacyl-[acyl-carrier protein] reductase
MGEAASMKLQDASILITGGTRGLGRQFSLDLAQAGARVGVCGTRADSLARLRHDFEELGLRVWTQEADVSDEGEVERLFEDFCAAHGRIDAVVNNAGITRDALLVRQRNGALEKMALECWQKVIDVNLTGVFLCGREAAFHMVRQGTPGVIVCISSICRNGNVGQTNYSAAKSGLAAMTVVWAKELARHGIRVAALAPGYLSTEMTEELRDDVRQKIEKAIPAGRMGQTGEVSHALRFVLENDYVTGRVIEVDGGMRL